MEKIPEYIPERQRKGKMRDLLKKKKHREWSENIWHWTSNMKIENESEAMLEEIHGQGNSRNDECHLSIRFKNLNEFQAIY